MSLDAATSIGYGAFGVNTSALELVEFLLARSLPMRTLQGIAIAIEVLTPMLGGSMINSSYAFFLRGLSDTTQGVEDPVRLKLIPQANEQMLTTCVSVNDPVPKDCAAQYTCIH